MPTTVPTSCIPTMSLMEKSSALTLTNQTLVELIHAYSGGIRKRGPPPSLRTPKYVFLHPGIRFQEDFEGGGVKREEGGNLTRRTT